ncbi:MAG: hypothetical protein ABR591_08945 [Candidatus Velthaea sp.]
MKPIAICALAVLASALPAKAADRPVTLTLDGRPVDRHGGIAVMRGDVVFADASDAKSFNGLISLRRDGSATITIGANTGTFVPAMPRARINSRSVLLPGAPFLRNGDLYVPLNAFIARMANARVRIDRRRARADIVVNANPLSRAASAAPRPAG